MKRVSFMFIGLFLGAVLFNSCQKEILNNDLATRSAANQFLSYSEDQICLGSEVTISFNNGYGNSCGMSTIQVSADGGNTWSALGSGAPSDGIFSYTYALSAAGEYLYRAHYVSSGPGCSGSTIPFNQTVASFPLVVSANCCSTSFSGIALSCDDTREALFTFTSEEALDFVRIQGGLTNFTGQDAEIIVTGGDLSVQQWTPGTSSNRVIRLEGSVAACETVTILIRWNSTNGDPVITGSWTVKDANGVELAPSVDDLTCQ